MPTLCLMLGVISSRASELERLREMLSRATKAPPVGAVVEGPAGIGKSTLLGAAVDEAERQGYAAFRARSEEFESERSFGAVAALVSALGRERRAPLVKLIESQPEQASAFRVIDQLVDAIEGEALRHPVLICLDDAQWADGWSVRALAITFRRLSALPVAFILGARPSPRSPELASLIASVTEGGVHIPLAPLDSEAVAELIRAITGADPAPGLRRMLERAGGNPFFVRELYEALDRDQILMVTGASVDVARNSTPPGLLVTVLHRMSSLPPKALELVRAAAVLSGSFTVDQLAVATGESPASILRPLMNLRDDGVLVEEGERFRFRHDLLREAVYEDLGGPVRAAMHTRLGHAFASAGLDTVDAAHHLLLGAQAPDPVAAEVMIEAAQSGRVTQRESAALLRRALELAPDHPHALGLKQRLANLLHHTDSPAEAMPLLEAVLADSDEPGAQLKLVGALAIAALRAGDSVARARWRHRADELADGLIGSSDPWVLLYVAQSQFDRGDVASANDTAVRAAALAVTAGDRAAEEEARNYSTWLLAGMGRPGEALEHSMRVLELCAGRPSAAMRLIHHGEVRHRLWQDEQAIGAMTRSRAISEEHGSIAVLLKAECGSAWLDYGAGRWEDAELRADTALQMMRELGISTDADHPALVRGWISFRSGDLESAQDWLRQGESCRNRAVSQWLQVRMLQAAGDTAGAVGVAEAIADSPPKYPAERFIEGLLPELSRIAVGARHKALAHRVLDLALGFGTDTTAPSLELAALRCRALVLRQVEAAEQALALVAACPGPLERAETLEDIAPLLPDRQAQIVTQSLEDYERVGSSFDIARLRPSGRRRPGLQRGGRPVTGWEALTDAERKVVELAAEGLTNREIGARLFISHRTAGTHLARSFDKLQVRSRVELARLVASR